MVAFGDMIVFVLAAGFLSLAPTWFLLKLCVEKIPRALIAVELLFALLGLASWLTVKWMAASVWMAGSVAPESPPHAFSPALGLLIAFGAIPRIVLGPVLLTIEGVAFFLVREPLTRALLAATMLMDLVPLSMYAWHMFGATPR
jgi:hypothetical protein